MIYPVNAAGECTYCGEPAHAENCVPCFDCSDLIGDFEPEAPARDKRERCERCHEDHARFEARVQWAYDNCERSLDASRDADFYSDSGIA